MSNTNPVADLSGFDVRARAQEGVDMPLLDPLGRKTGVTFRVRGTDCRAYQEMLQEQIRRGIERAPRRATEAEKNAEFWELQATLVPSWTPAQLIFEAGGAPCECTPANVARFLETQQYAFEQVRRFADQRGNFLPGSSSS